MSEAVELKLVKLLDHPTTSPYGNPIPGLDKLGEGEPAPPAEPDLVRLDEVARQGGGDVEIRRIAEHVQIDEDLMTKLRAAGLIPGHKVHVGKANGSADVAITGEGESIEVPHAVLHAVLATAVD